MTEDQLVQALNTYSFSIPEGGRFDCGSGFYKVQSNNSTLIRYILRVAISRESVIVEFNYKSSKPLLSSSRRAHVERLIGKSHYLKHAKLEQLKVVVAFLDHAHEFEVIPHYTPEEYRALTLGDFNKVYQNEFVEHYYDPKCGCDACYDKATKPEHGFYRPGDRHRPVQEQIVPTEEQRPTIEYAKMEWADPNKPTQRIPVLRKPPLGEVPTCSGCNERIDSVYECGNVVADFVRNLVTDHDSQPAYTILFQQLSNKLGLQGKCAETKEDLVNAARHWYMMRKNNHLVRKKSS